MTATTVTRSFSRSALKYGSDEYNCFISNSDQVAGSLTAEETQAVFEYTGWFYADYQEFLNRPEDEPIKLSDAHYVAGVTHLDSATAKNVSARKRTLYRGAVNPETHVVGETVTFLSFISTSVNSQVAVDIVSGKPDAVIYEFFTEEGIELNDATSEQGLREKEVLLGRGKTFTVKSIEKNVEFRNGPRTQFHTVVKLG